MVAGARFIQARTSPELRRAVYPSRENGSSVNFRTASVDVVHIACCRSFRFVAESQADLLERVAQAVKVGANSMAERVRVGMGDLKTGYQSPHSFRDR
jgi:hypothetical protein